MTRRAAWPTLTVTILALLAVLAVLLLTGSRSGASARFSLATSPSVISLTAGDGADLVLTVTAAAGFDATIALSTTTLPPGVRLDLDRGSVPVSGNRPPARIAGRLSTSSSAATGAVGIEVIGRAGAASATGLIQLHIQPTGITDLTYPPPTPVVGTQNASFSVSGAPHGMLAPGQLLPIDLRLVNANPFPLSISELTVAIAGTSKPACRPENFSIVPYRGGYPLRLPAGSTSTLSSLRVPAGRWPQLHMVHAPNRDACRGVTVRLRYTGAGSG